MQASTKINPFILMKQGGNAIAQVQGMKKAVFTGFLINLIVYLLLAAAMVTLFLLYAYTPIDTWLMESAPSWLAWAGRVVLWLVLVAVTLVSLLFSFRISLKFMGFWYEALADKVVVHFRGKQDGGFSFKGAVVDMGRTLLGVMTEVAIAIGLLFLGFIPLIGAPLVFILGSHLMGKAVLDPYRNVLRARDQEWGLPKGDHFGTLRIGWTEMVLALIPILGWLVMPISLVYQVIGLAWQEESAAAT